MVGNPTFHSNDPRDRSQVSPSSHVLVSYPNTCIWSLLSIYVPILCTLVCECLLLTCVIARSRIVQVPSRVLTLLAKKKKKNENADVASLLLDGHLAIFAFISTILGTFDRKMFNIMLKNSITGKQIAHKNSLDSTCNVNMISLKKN